MDTSPYGLRHAAGNARDWCAEVAPAVPNTRDGRVDVQPDRKIEASHCVRGGTFEDVPINARSANRFRGGPNYRSVYVSVRGARRIGPS